MSNYKPVTITIDIRIIYSALINSDVDFEQFALGNILESSFNKFSSLIPIKQDYSVSNSANEFNVNLMLKNLKEYEYNNIKYFGAILTDKLISYLSSAFEAACGSDMDINGIIPSNAINDTITEYEESHDTVTNDYDILTIKIEDGE